MYGGIILHSYVLPRTLMHKLLQTLRWNPSKMTSHASCMAEMLMLFQSFTSPCVGAIHKPVRPVNLTATCLVHKRDSVPSPHWSLEAEQP